MAAPIRFALRRVLLRNHAVFSCSKCRNSSEAAAGNAQTVGDPMPVFMQEEVQSLLRNMTGFDIQRVAGPQKVPLKKPRYQLLTDQELQEVQKEAESRLKYRLQIPPFMKAREPVQAVLSSDPDLQGLDSSKYIFTDITFGVKNRQRVMVVREADGTLRKADWEERDRMNQIYNPVPGRHFEVPKMFQEEKLEMLLKKQKYVYVLDIACVQFEPDDPEYIRVTHRTFEAIDSKHHYDNLRSTRHFGSMAFYYTWYKKIDYLLVDMMSRELLSDASDLVRLYCIIHPDSPIAQQLSAQQEQDVLSVVKVFCSVEASHKGQLELAIQGYEEKQRTAAVSTKS